MSLCLLLLSLGCTDGEVRDSTASTEPVDSGETSSWPVHRGLSVLSGPEVKKPRSRNVGLVRRVALSTDLPCSISFTLEGPTGVREIALDGVSTRHDVPILGLRNHAEHTLVLTLTGTDGTVLVLEPIVIEIDEELPEFFPVIDVLVRDLDRMEPGYRFLNLKRLEENTVMLVVFDEELEPVHWAQGKGWGDVRMSPRGTWMGVAGGDAMEVDLLGETLRRYSGDPRSEDDIEASFSYLHHELFEEADGTFWSLDLETVEVPAYPTSYEEPEVLGGPVELRASSVVHFDGEGAVLDRWPLSEVLDTTRIGFDSLDETDLGLDWLHANAVVPVPAGEGVIVGTRHQGAAVKLDGEGQPVWILSDPHGWGESFEALLLEPVGESFEWPYHQHGVTVTDDGLIQMFDNHNNDCTPYHDKCPRHWRSRVVAFEVDEQAMTVRQVWSFDTTSTGVLEAPAMGDADTLPTTGNVLADFGMLTEEEGVRNQEQGFGRSSVRLIEFIPGDPGETVLDMRIRSDGATDPEGFKSYRSEWVPELYP